MKLSAFLICFFLCCILTLLAEQFNLEGWSSNLVGWIGGIAVGILGALLAIEWIKEK